HYPPHRACPPAPPGTCRRLRGRPLTCLTALQRWLTNAGSIRLLRLRVVKAVVLAADAVAGALPGGTAFTAAWIFRRFRRHGAGQTPAGALLVSGLISHPTPALLLAGVPADGYPGPALPRIPWSSVWPPSWPLPRAGHGACPVRPDATPGR